jgi:hypothetical protein
MRAGAIALLALAAVWPTARRWRVAVAALGAVLLVASTWDAAFAHRAHEWALVVGVVAAIALWWAAPTAHERLRVRGLAWWTLLGSAAAIYACVPETDQMREVAVVVAAGGAAEWLLHRPLPTTALVAAASYVEWSALYGSAGLARALAGGLFALTPLVAVAASPTDRRAPLVALTWIGAAGAVARTGGVASSLPPAVAAVAVGAVCAAAVSAVLVRRPS